jgi:hypothetical protein
VDLVGQRPEPIPQRRKRVGEMRCRHRGLQFGWGDFGLRGSKTEQHAVRGEPALAGRLAEDEVGIRQRHGNGGCRRPGTRQLAAQRDTSAAECSRPRKQPEPQAVGSDHDEPSVRDRRPVMLDHSLGKIPARNQAAPRSGTAA